MNVFKLGLLKANELSRGLHNFKIADKLKQKTTLRIFLCYHHKLLTHKSAASLFTFQPLDARSCSRRLWGGVRFVFFIAAFTLGYVTFMRSADWWLDLSWCKLTNQDQFNLALLSWWNEPTERRWRCHIVRRRCLRLAPSQSELKAESTCYFLAVCSI